MISPKEFLKDVLQEEEELRRKEEDIRNNVEQKNPKTGINKGKSKWVLPVLTVTLIMISWGYYSKIKLKFWTTIIYNTQGNDLS